MEGETETKLPRLAPPNFTDHHFRTSSGVDLAVRIWPADPPVTSPAPFVTWTHGGGFLAGHHFAPLAWMYPGFVQRGYHMVSHNYRLGPQVRVDEILQDCLEAMSWCRSNLPSILGEDKVDVNQHVVCGESAGGLLAMLMGFHLSPPPKAIINGYSTGSLSLSGFGAIPPDTDTKLPPMEHSEEELATYLSDRSSGQELTTALFWVEHLRFSQEQLNQRWRTSELVLTPRVILQAELHIYRSLRTNFAGFLKCAFHQEKFADREALAAFVSSMSPMTLLESKSWFPPTAFLHGTADPEVPVAQSLAMAAKLREKGVPVVECYEPGGVHVFDNKYTNATVAGWDQYIQPVLDFVKIQLQVSQTKEK